MQDSDKIPVCAIGVLPNVPYVYWDYDFDHETEYDALAILKDIANGITQRENDCVPTHYHY